MSTEQNQLTEGFYNAVCTGEVKYGATDKGTKQVGVELKIETTAVWAILYFSEKAKEFSIDKLRACGWDGVGAIEPQIKGQTVRAGIKYEEFEGKLRMKVDIFTGGGGFKFKAEMDDGTKADFMKELRAMAGDTKPAYPKGWDDVKPEATNAEPRKPFSLE